MMKSYRSLTEGRSVFKNSLPGSGGWLASAAMQPPTAPFRRLVCAVLLAAFAWALVLAASPYLHKWAHHDAGDAHHECAATLIHHGGIDDTPAPAFTVAFLPVVFAQIGAPRLDWVPSLFSGSRIFEHGPPALA